MSASDGTLTAKEKARERMKRWRAAKREHIQAYQKDWKAKNADRIKAYNAEYMPGYYNRETSAAERRRRGLKAYNLTPDDFDLMWAEQEGKCAICQHEMKPCGRTKDAVAVDHNHATGEVRGLLCRGCNHGIGNLKDDPEVLLKAAQYLKEKGNYAHLRSAVNA